MKIQAQKDSLKKSFPKTGWRAGLIRWRADERKAGTDLRSDIVLLGAILEANNNAKPRRTDSGNRPAHFGTRQR
jgi:hypothetical protein